MNFRADMVSHETDDAFAVCRGKDGVSFAQAFRQAVDPEPPVRVDHHFDDGRIFKESGDVRPERGAKHACAARCRFGSC